MWYEYDGVDLMAEEIVCCLPSLPVSASPGRQTAALVGASRRSLSERTSRTCNIACLP